MVTLLVALVVALTVAAFCEKFLLTTLPAMVAATLSVPHAVAVPGAPVVRICTKQETSQLRFAKLVFSALLPPEYWQTPVVPNAFTLMCSIGVAVAVVVYTPCALI